MRDGNSDLEIASFYHLIDTRHMSKVLPLRGPLDLFSNRVSLSAGVGRAFQQTLDNDWLKLIQVIQVEEVAASIPGVFNTVVHFWSGKRVNTFGDAIRCKPEYKGAAWSSTITRNSIICYVCMYVVGIKRLTP